jgi:acyl-CoA thioester hydrolase
MDNDAYGHVNNVVYYSFFDTAVNRYLIDRGALDIARSDTFGVVVETMCRFYEPLAFPEPIEAGLRITRIGRTSIRWELGIFRPGAAQAAADGHFVQVFVDRKSRRPAPVPEAARAAALPLLVERETSQAG